MNFLLDHDVPAEIAHLSRYWGHNVTRLPTVLPITAPDKEVFGYACLEGLILISYNRNHFLSLARQTQKQPGLIFLIRRRTRQSECAHLSVLLQRAGESGLRNMNALAKVVIPAPGSRRRCFRTSQNPGLRKQFCEHRARA